MLNLNLNHEGYEEYLVGTVKRLGGVGYKFRFENGYGASVIKHSGSYGHEDDKWELAVIKWRGNESELEYDTDITDDVIGWLTDEEVRNLLKKIKELKRLPTN